MINNFKPMLAIDVKNNLDKIQYPKYASFKLDGIRCVFHPELGMVSRSLKPIQNKQLQEKFSWLTELSKDLGTIFDGEIYAHNLTFQDIMRAVMTQDFDDESTMKKMEKEFGDIIKSSEYIINLLGNIRYHCFDMLYPDDPNVEFYNRTLIMEQVEEHIMNNKLFHLVEQFKVHDAEHVNDLFKIALDKGYEGLILRDPDSPYKFGRSTLKEEYLLKVKPFVTYDAKIVEVIQATEVDPNAEKEINELGYSKTSRKKDDRIPIEKAAAFKVMYEGHALKVSIAMTDPEKEEVWKNRESYIGRMIEYKGMQIGAKDVPRHPVFLRFREDK